MEKLSSTKLAPGADKVVLYDNSFLKVILRQIFTTYQLRPKKKKNVALHTVVKIKKSFNAPLVKLSLHIYIIELFAAIKIMF